MMQIKIFTSQNLSPNFDTNSRYNPPPLDKNPSDKNPTNSDNSGQTGIIIQI